MARLCLIGDSNVNASISPTKMSQAIGHSVIYHRATNRTSVDNYLVAAQHENYEVLVLSVLPNLICDLSVGSIPASLNTLYESVISRLVSIGIQKVLLVPPILRFQPSWYPENFALMVKTLQDSLLGVQGIHLLPVFPVSITDVSSDGVHFTSSTSSRFFDYLVSSVKDVIETEVVQVPKPATTLDDLASLIKSSLPDLSKKVKNKNNALNNNHEM